MKKLFLVCLLLLGLALSGFGCNSASSQSEKESSSEEASKPVTKIMLAGGRVGDSWYSIAQAAAKFVNEKSDWLRMEVVATAGLTANLELVRDNPKEYVGILPLSTTLHSRSGHKYSDARGVYDGVRFIANSTSMTQLLVTFDPAIKTPEDLKGKTIGVGREGAGNTYDHLAVLESLGVLDDVKLVHGGFGGNIDKLVNGLTDATFTMIDHIYPKTFKKGSLIEKAGIRGPVHYLGFDQDMLLQLRSSEHSTVPVRIPAGALDPEQQPNELWAFNDPTYFGTDEQMDKEVVYELTRILFETPAEEWVKWHPQGAHMTEDIKPANPVPEKLEIHPGAKQYYEELGIEMKDLAELLR